MNRRRGIVLLAGGLGGARLAPALARRRPPGGLTVVANVGDDALWYGLRVCPDVDAILYALAGVWDAERSFGRTDETFHVRDALGALGVPNWFGVGDRDLALQLLRAERLRAGVGLTEVTAELARRLGVRGAVVLPASEALAATKMVLTDGRILDFQRWFVAERAKPRIAEVRFARARPAEGVLQALRSARAVVLGPSNPVTSLAPILALRGVRRAVREIPVRVAVSPVVAGRKGTPHPGVVRRALARRRVLAAEGRVDRPGSIAERFNGLVKTFLLDEADRGDADRVAAAGLAPVIVEDLLDDDLLARTVGSLAGRGAGRLAQRPNWS